MISLSMAITFPTKSDRKKFYGTFFYCLKERERATSPINTQNEATKLRVTTFAFAKLEERLQYLRKNSYIIFWKKNVNDVHCT